MPVSRISTCVAWSSKVGGLRWDGPVVAGLDFFEVVERLAKSVEQPAERGVAHGNGDGVAGVNGVNAAHQSLGRAEPEAAHPVVADVLLDLKHQTLARNAGLQRIVDCRHVF